MKKLLSLLFFIVMFYSSVEAQLTISPDTVETKPGQKVNVGLRVKGFEHLIALQFTLQWDPAVLKYDTVDNIHLPELKPDGIGAHPDTIAAGKIGFTWTSVQNGGVILPDGTSMLDFVFDVIGQKGDSSFIKVVDSPLEFEADDTLFNDIGIIPKIGLVRVGTPTSITDQFSDVNGFRLYNPDPNPFKNNTIIAWDSPQNSQVLIFISDLSGKEVYSIKNYNNIKGRNQITLSAKDLPESGTYIFGIQSGKSLLTRKIILIN
ncbi:MAG TPA: T9SS type A sorting domain-containing protein [Saprospiraceae bacterium]|nr:T9SS type A sorting domain-containing protein [Saprospiraceae bacterium]